MKLLLKITVCCLCFIAPFQANASHLGQINLLIHPFLTNAKIEKNFTPLARYLSNQLGRIVNLKVSKSYSEHIKSIGEDQFDIAFMGPYSYVKMVGQYGQKQILGRLEVNSKPFFKGKIVAQIDSPIRKIKDLKNKRFAFGDISSTMSYIMPRAILANNGIALSDLKSYHHYQSHNAVIAAVISGDADAGAVKEEVYYENSGQLKSIASTPAVSEHLFLVSKNLSLVWVKKIKTALLTMNKNKLGLVAMRSINPLMTGVVPATFKNYENLSNIYSKYQ